MKGMVCFSAMSSAYQFLNKTFLKQSFDELIN
jgi:hypothetical protein